MPALQIDGQIITEGPAIVTYIGLLKPERQLLGASPVETAKVNEWLTWLSGTLHGQGYGALWRPNRFTESDDAAVNDSIRKKGRKTIMDCYDRIEKNVEGLHAVGDSPTAVDVTLYNLLAMGAFALGIKPEDFAERYPKYTKLVRGVEKWDSIQKTLSKEGRLWRSDSSVSDRTIWRDMQAVLRLMALLGFSFASPISLPLPPTSYLVACSRQGSHFSRCEASGTGPRFKRPAVSRSSVQLGH